MAPAEVANTSLKSVAPPSAWSASSPSGRVHAAHSSAFDHEPEPVSIAAVPTAQTALNHTEHRFGIPTGQKLRWKQQPSRYRHVLKMRMQPGSLGASLRD